MENSLGMVICPECGKEFLRKNMMQVFCCESCRDKSFLRGCEIVEFDPEKEPQKTFTYTQCVICGRYFKPFAKRSNQRYCSEACKREGKRRTSQKHNRHEQIRKAREREEAKQKKQNACPPRKPEKDGFTWDDVRAVLKEFQISSYHKAIAILEQRKKEKHNDLQREIKD